jgi:uncharacterized membrane protein
MLIILIAAGTLLVLLLAAVGFLLWKVTSADSPQATTQRILTETGRIYLLPEGEKPVVARIQDRAKLTGQEFYANAKNGDYVIVYKEHKLALIYRDGAHKVIIAAPITPGDPSN